ncbi:peptidoglycan hydrolase [Providencia phage PSTRCR_127]|nr:peptidoglycan hydrolase [Providencia phage PSTRCR_127]
MYKLSQRSLKNLEGVHPDLVKVVKRAIEISDVDFGITEGLRSVERQRQLGKEGKSQIQNPENGMHVLGKAVDTLAYPTPSGSWEWKYYEQIDKAMKQAGKELGIPVEWGGDWKFKDGVHFQLPRSYN